MLDGRHDQLFEQARYLKADEARARILNAGSEVVASSPQQLAAKIQADIARLDKVIKDAGTRAD